MLVNCITSNNSINGAVQSQNMYTSSTALRLANLLKYWTTISSPRIMPWISQEKLSTFFPIASRVSVKCGIAECGKLNAERTMRHCGMVCKLWNAESLQTYSVTAEGSPFAPQGSHRTSLHQYTSQRAAYTTKTLFIFTQKLNCYSQRYLYKNFYFIHSKKLKLNAIIWAFIDTI